MLNCIYHRSNMPQEIISKFREKPKNKTAWRAMWLGLATFLIFPALGIFAAIINPLIIRITGERIGMVSGFVMVILSLMLSISALIIGIRAFRQGERSWVLWVGFIPAILVGLFWIFMIVGEILIPH